MGAVRLDDRRGQPVQHGQLPLLVFVRLKLRAEFFK